MPVQSLTVCFSFEIPVEELFLWAESWLFCDEWIVDALEAAAPAASCPYLCVAVFSIFGSQWQDSRLHEHEKGLPTRHSLWQIEKAWRKPKAEGEG